MKTLKEIYNDFALTYEKNRGIFDMSEIIENFYKNIKVSNGKVLDLGCGAGEPFAKFFIDRNFEVTGVDFSEKMLELAKKYVPKMNTILSDITEINFPSESFDIITSIYSLFHLTNENQLKILKNTYKWLKKDSFMLFTYATKEYTGKMEFEGYKEFMGKKLFYAHKTPDFLKNFLKNIGFNIISFDYKTIADETFLWITVKK